MKSLTLAGVVFLAALCGACIRPQNYHSGNSSVVALKFPDGPAGQGNYFHQAKVWEAYIEFNAQGQSFQPDQTTRAVDLIHTLQNRTPGQTKPVFVMVFVHGWKNDASEDSNNVWGFRRMLDHQAAKLNSSNPDLPVVGIYMGWPGAATKVGKFFSFWNREQVAYTVGAGDLESSLLRVMKAAKGEKFDGDSKTVLIGHSFGGLVMERAVIRLLTDYIDAMQPGDTLPPPADLMLVVNEAGPASQAKPFLEKLQSRKIVYRDENKQPHPLLASMTSDGDIATKIAFPGGEFLSSNRPATQNLDPKTDIFRQSSTLSYNLLTAANFVGMRSHQIAPVSNGAACGEGVYIPDIHKVNYCVSPLDSLNKTAYWIMALPQVFVPDHGSIFRGELIVLVSAFLAQHNLMEPSKVNPRPGTKMVQRSMATAVAPKKLILERLP